VISYGLFLWHIAVLVTLDEKGATEWIPGPPFVVLTIATLIVATACATVSYYLVERPCLRLKYWLGVRARAPACGLVSPSATLSGRR